MNFLITINFIYLLILSELVSSDDRQMKMQKVIAQCLLLFKEFLNHYKYLLIINFFFFISLKQDLFFNYNFFQTVVLCEAMGNDKLVNQQSIIYNNNQTLTTLNHTFDILRNLNNEEGINVEHLQSYATIIDTQIHNFVSTGTHRMETATTLNDLIMLFEQYTDNLRNQMQPGLLE